MTFAYHQILYAAIAAPFALLLIFVYDRMQRRRLATRLGELPVLGKVMASTSPRRRWIKWLLTSLGVSAILVAAARPQIAGKRKVELRGLDLVLAVDVSKSMLVDDVGQTLLVVGVAVSMSWLVLAVAKPLRIQ